MSVKIATTKKQRKSKKAAQVETPVLDERNAFEPMVGANEPKGEDGLPIPIPIVELAPITPPQPEPETAAEPEVRVELTDAKETKLYCTGILGGKSRWWLKDKLISHSIDPETKTATVVLTAAQAKLWRAA